MKDQQGALHERKEGSAGRFGLKALTLLGISLLCGYGSAQIDRHPAASLTRKIGLPTQFLVGLGNTDTADIKSGKIKVDIVDRYLMGVGESSWASWNASPGEYIRIVTEKADFIGAVPMFILAQMAGVSGEKLSSLMDRTFMVQYWDNVRLLFSSLWQYNSPALVNLEPDFWGHAQKSALNNDPSSVGVLVSVNPDCADLPDNVSGMAACFMRSGHRYAPRVQLGFPISDWGAGEPAQVGRFMRRLGAGRADFVVLPSENHVAKAYDFNDYVKKVKFYHEVMDGLPVLAWRASLSGASVDSESNYLRVFLKHPGKMVAAGAIGAVFCAGESDPASIMDDDGSFRILSFQYSIRPVPLS